MCVSYSILFYPGRSVKPVLMLQKRGGARASRAYRRQSRGEAAQIAILKRATVCNNADLSRLLDWQFQI